MCCAGVGHGNPLAKISEERENEDTSTNGEDKDELSKNKDEESDPFHHSPLDEDFLQNSNSSPSMESLKEVDQNSCSLSGPHTTIVMENGDENVRGNLQQEGPYLEEGLQLMVRIAMPCHSTRFPGRKPN